MGAILPPLVRLSDPERPLRDESPGFVCIALFSGALLLHWYFRRAELRLSPDDLEWRTPFYQRTVAWNEIESFGSTPTTTGWIEVAGKKMNLNLVWIPVSQRSRLHAEIEKRAFNARGSWE